MVTSTEAPPPQSQWNLSFSARPTLFARSSHTSFPLSHTCTWMPSRKVMALLYSKVRPVMQRAGLDVGVGLAVVGVGVDQLAQLDLVMVASNLGPPSSNHVVLETHEAPDGLDPPPDVSVGRSGRPKLAHDVVVMQAAPRGPPLHCRTVVVERHHSPGPAVAPGPGPTVKSGGSVKGGVVDGPEPSGGWPWVSGEHQKPVQSLPQLEPVQSGAGGPGLYSMGGPCGVAPGVPGSGQEACRRTSPVSRVVGQVAPTPFQTSPLALPPSPFSNVSLRSWTKIHSLMDGGSLPPV